MLNNNNNKKMCSMIQTSSEKKKFQLWVDMYRESIRGRERDIAKDIGVHFNTVYNYLSGFHPNKETCKKIMDASQKYIEKIEK